MDRQAIMSRALRHGFTLRQQPGGEMDLNPYVYAFAREMFESGRNAAISAAADRCEAICHKYMRGDGRKSDAADECKDAVRRMYRDAPDCAGAQHERQDASDEGQGHNQEIRS